MSRTTGIVLKNYLEFFIRQIKYAPDTDSAGIYDLIRRTMFLDFMYFYGSAIGNPADSFVNFFITEIR